MTTRHRKSFGTRAFCALMSVLLAIPLFAAAASAYPGPAAPTYTGPLTWTEYTEPVSPSPIAEYFTPYALAFDGDDNLYVANFSSHTIQEGPERGRIQRISDNGLSVTDITYNAMVTYPFGIVADHLGNVYVTDNSTTGTSGNTARILKRDPITGTWENMNNGDIKFPRGISADRQGNLYVVDSAMTVDRPTTIWKWSSQSEEWGAIAGPEFTAGSYGFDIAVDSAGNLYVDTVGGNGRIKKLPAGGTEWIDVTPTSASVFIAFGMGIDAHDNLYVMNMGTGSVWKLGWNGDSEDWTEIAATTIESGLWDVAADSHGYVYGTSIVNNNVKAMRATVKYNGNGQSSGTVPSDTQAYRPDQTATVLGAGDMIKTDRVFSGWATSPTATVAEYAPGDSIGMTQTVTLYAVWTTVPIVTITDIQLDNPAYTLSVGGTRQSVVTAVYSDTSTAPLTSGVTFASDNTAVATVDGTGLVTAVARGQAAITAEFEGLQATATVTVQAPSSPPASGATTPPVPEPEPGVEIIVDGVKQEKLATARKNEAGGRTITTVVLDSAKIADKLDRDNSKLITIPVAGNGGDVIGQLNVGLVRKMQEKGASVQIQTDRATYTLPASQIDVDDILSKLGQGATPEDIKVNIRISDTSSDNQELAQSGARKLGAQLVLQPIDFEITVDYGARTIEANKFNSYVERSIVIPEGVDPSRITTGVVLSPDGSLSHVPTVVKQENGQYYATINSLTNSTYSVIFNPREMWDVSNHWAKDDVNDLSSRLIVSGVTGKMFAPDATITRAEFAAIVTRGLGIRSATYAGGFSDVAASDLHAGAIQAVADYKLVSGYEDGTFRPNARMTRQEGAVLLARAAAVAKPSANLAAEEMDRLLSAFSDGGNVAGWSRSSVAAAVRLHLLQGRNGKLELEANLTRAETAALVRRLLRTANLID
ncbi:S-layer homology domain-containing protein [Cohnella panacarvi]|uniref:S-layer homology domain-containing protein n=1 Tax=Cohnella panacarvi TaxID=400776 RepID=UPI00047AC4E8|nr:S-layer homology domain-containing protein [Cohnella panacarvi]